MSPSSVQSALRILLEAEQSGPWRQMPVGKVAGLLNQVAGRFFLFGDALAYETAARMGVTAGEVWLETIIPSVWGLLSTRRGLLENAGAGGSLEEVGYTFPRHRITSFAGRPALRLLPANSLESLLLPDFSGYVLLRNARADEGVALEHSTTHPTHDLTRSSPALALCLLPFNLASIGALDIIHMLCYRKLRVAAKVSEKVEFVGPHLERIFEPLLEARALQLVYGGPDAGAWLAARPEFAHVHLTGSAQTAAAVEQAAGRGRVSSELGGVTAAIILPDSLSNASRLRQVARQLAFGALANNGQHCVSFQIAIVPGSREADLARALWEEMMLAARREPSHDGTRLLVDGAAARRVEALVASLVAEGARLRPETAKAVERHFPVCLVQGINEKMRLFREEAFAPVLGLMSVPDENFAGQALALANSGDIDGDLGISLFTSNPRSPEVERIAASLRHGVVTINTYPGVAFATSVPWGAGPSGLSGRGWVHNYDVLPEEIIDKVVLSTSLGRKGFGLLRWEDPWLLNVSGEGTVQLAKALVRTTLAYFRQARWSLWAAELSLVAAIARREWVARALDGRRGEPSSE